MDGGYIPSDNGAKVSARGICWSTITGPELPQAFQTRSFNQNRKG